jgi:hypothetical protein
VKEATMNLSRTCCIVLTLAIAGLLGACGDPPSGLAPTPPPGAPAPTLLRVEIAGPDVVPPGGTAQFTAMAHYSDGSTQDITRDCGSVWRSSDVAVLTISEDGIVSGVAPGETAITLDYWGSPTSGCGIGAGGARRDVMVLPPGTFRLSGMVHGEGFPVSSAQITVTGGQGPPLSTVSGGDGRYRVYGVAGRVEVRAASAGYHQASLHADIGGHETLNIELTPVELTPDHDQVAGSYRLTINPLGGCWTQPPSRTYTATLDQQNGQLLGTLGGADFEIESGRLLNRFSGFVQPDRLRLSFASGDVVEVISRDPPARLAFFGEAGLNRVAGDRYEGTLMGTLIYPVVNGPGPSWCGGQHQLVLTR